MTEHHAESRKIDPTRAGRGQRPDGSPADNDRAEIGPTRLAFAEWAEAGLEVPDLARMRAERHARLVQGIVERGLAGALLFDPLNIRFATDSTNMQLWNAHNPFRACFVGADGYMVLFDFKGGPDKMLSDFNPLVREVRAGASMFYFATGDRGEVAAHEFIQQIQELVAAHGDGKRLAVDKIMVAGYRALTQANFEVTDGEELTEKARAVKGADEIRALRCAVHSCERAVAAMEAVAAPGMTEDDVWAVLHAENIRRGGEWIECRLLASGPRTNPWFQECGPRVIQNGEILAFDTDLIGPYGMCADISRTWWIGDGEPTPEMKRLYRVAHEHIVENTALLKPGVRFREITFGGHQLADEFVESRYGVKMHGVGLCDEWPSIRYPQDWREGAFDYEIRPGMALCVEALIAHKGGDFSIKLEDQVVVTETGVENMTTYPFDRRFLG
jgi:Xaa-Pro aminopeptidase